MWASFAEVCVPLAGVEVQGCGSQAKGGWRSLDFTVSGRYEHYSDLGGKAVPVLKLDVSPVKDISFEAVWRQAFKVPSLAERNEAHNSSGILPLANPQSPTGISEALVWTGANADLRPEVAREWTVSARVRPSEVPGLVVYGKYFDIDYRDRVVQPMLNADALISASGEQVVTVNPSPQQRQTVCSRSQFFGVATDCLTVPIYAMVDTRLANLSQVRLNGVDLNVEYGFRGNHGEWRFGIYGSYVFEYDVIQPSGESNVVDSPGEPAQLRALTFVGWNGQRLEVDGFLHYSDGYRDFVDPLGGNVRSWTTVDGQIVWRCGSNEERGPGGLKLSVAIQNLFNLDPPFVNYSLGMGYDPKMSNDRGRVVSVNITKSW